ncbi:MAG: NRDE family protein [Hydrogenophaga sp.]|jgi:uncharacterized protein with NRDE domain|uniref:NRDE family protein n=1 Tax=Hydrogenophaga sp. TaxID=1904254 RepID=UPI001DFD1C29|nr:NRDE family protein [Hydrogenophaga sp.]MBW0171554.1 NRDE family protein [Hydrogenophaga sp.]MBW0182855.1 NRDE family protein [Hydrogenophaga sp.]
MCLIAFALHADPVCPLLIAANRDEFLDRPTEGLHRWALADGTLIVAGRDLKDGGTWLGVSPNGRVAMLTNVRQRLAGPGSRSRGELATRWLQGSASEEQLAAAIDPAAYGGFNLVVGDFHRRRWSWLSNRRPDAPHESHPPALHHRALEPGIYGLSNASLDTPWPKTLRLKQAVADALAGRREHGDGARWTEPLAGALADSTAAADADLPHTGVPDDMERALSSPFVLMPGRAYGTRSSLVVCATQATAGWDVEMHEWTHDHTQAVAGGFERSVRRSESLAW